MIGSHPYKTFLQHVAEGKVPGHKLIEAVGRIPDLDENDGFKAVWSGSTSGYTGFTPTSADTLEVLSSSANDAGSEVIAGTVSSYPTIVTLQDLEVNFEAAGVAVGDCLVNDTQKWHRIIRTVAPTQLGLFRKISRESFEAEDNYRIVTTTSTGLGLVRLEGLLDANYEEAVEYVILNGASAVDTVGSYLRQSRGKGILGINNLGDVTVRQKNTPANITMLMPALLGADMLAAATVPVGKRGYIYGTYGSVGGRNGGGGEEEEDRKTAYSSFRLRTTRFGECNVLEGERTLYAGGKSSGDSILGTLKGPLEEGTDIICEADTSEDGVIVNAGISLLLVDF